MRRFAVLFRASVLGFVALLGIPAAFAGPPAATFLRAQPARLFDVSPPLRDAPPSSRAELPLPVSGRDVARAGGVAGSGGASALPGILANFDATSSAGAVPPLPSGDVGPNHFVLLSNDRMQVFDKTGTSLLGPVDLRTSLWAGFGGLCTSDLANYATVVYDQLADRWLIGSVTLVGPNYCLCVALSTSSDPLGTYYRWSFNFATHLLDAPKFAMWPDGYYISARDFESVNYSIRVMALDRVAMLAGVANPTMIQFLKDGTSAVADQDLGDGLQPADLDGTAPPPAGAPALFLGSMDDGGPYTAPQDALTLWRFHADFAVPALSTFTLTTTLPTNAFDSIFPCSGGGRGCLPQLGTSVKVDVQSYRQRLLNRVAYRNFGTHQSIVGCQSSEYSSAIAGTRWFEIRDPHGTPFFHQQGSYAPGVTDGLHRWNGSLAMDHVGNLALGYSVTSAGIYPGIRYTGRLAGDALGTMPQGEGILVNGGGAQTSTAMRWGDYSSMSVDPDDCTFWYVNQYYPATSTTGWRLHVGSFRFGDCVAATAVAPSGAGLTRLGPFDLFRGGGPVRFTLAGVGRRHVELQIYDLAGRRVRTLMSAELDAGRYDVSWDGTSDLGTRLAAGVYLVRLDAGRERISRTAVLVK